MPTACPFCTPSADRVFLDTEHVLALWDAYPVSAGHALLVTRRHLADWFAATDVERVALTSVIGDACREIERSHRPDGFNIGINLGEAAGQTVFHLHIHVIPRYRGDVAQPRGGVRAVIPSRANYPEKP